MQDPTPLPDRQQPGLPGAEPLDGSGFEDETSDDDEEEEQQ